MENRQTQTRHSECTRRAAFGRVMLTFHNNSPGNSDTGSRLSFARLEPDPNGPQNFNTQGNCLKMNSGAS
jgi:hypothetical protein